MLRKRLITLVFCLILIFVLSINAQTKFDLISMKDKIPPDPQIKIGKLSNGLTYFIKENRKPEKRMEVMLVLKAGATLEDDDQNGLAHFCEHMAFNGTKKYPKQKLIDFLESTGVKFGPDLNAFTSYDETVYMLQIPTDKPELIEQGLDVLDEWSHNVAYEDNEIDKERGVILEEWRLGKGAEDRCEKKHEKKIYYNSRYAMRDVIGDTNIILRAPYSAFTRFYHDWYRPDLMAVIAVGDFNMKDVEEKIKAHFSKLANPQKERPRTEYPMPPHKENLVSVATDKELGYPMVRIYFKRPGKEEGTYESYRENVVHSIFTQMLSKRLDEYQRKPNPPFTYYVAAWDGRFEGKSACMTLFAYTRGDAIGLCTETLLTEAFRAMQHGFTKTELERAKDESLRNMEQAYLERDKTESQNYSFEYMRNFLENEAIPGIAAELELYKKWLPDVTLEEINALSNKLVRKENTVIAISAPEKPDVKVPDDKEVLAMFNKISSSIIPAYVDEVSDKPLFSKKLKEGHIIGETKYDEIQLTELMLDNGIKVYLKPTDFKNDEIVFTSYCKGGTSLAPDKCYYSANAAASIINQSGIGEFNETQLEKKLAGKVVSVYPSIGELTEGIQGSCSPEDMETMFQLINLYFTEPRKDNESFKAYIEKQLAQVRDSKNSPRTTWQDTIRVTLNKYHFRSMPMTEEKVKEIDLDKAIKFYKDRFSDANDFSFFFVGNFEVDKIKDMLTLYLGSLPTLKKEKNWEDIRKFLPEGIINKEVHKGIEAQSYVWLTINGPFEWTLDNRYYIESLMDAFDIRLREVLREDKGGTYGVGAWDTPEHFPRDQYTINIVWGCDPKRVDELVKAVMDLIKEMKDKPLDEIYLTKVKETQKRNREVQLKENREWLSLLKSYFFYGDHPLQILEKSVRIEKLTLQDLHQAANKYFNTNNLVKVVLYPEKKD